MLWNLFVANEQGRNTTGEIAGRVTGSSLLAGRAPAVVPPVQTPMLADGSSPACNDLPAGVLCEEAPAKHVGIAPLTPPPASPDNNREAPSLGAMGAP